MSCCMLLVYYLSVNCLFSDYARQYLLKMGGQLDKCMLHWQPATLYFQLFIIVRYLANKLQLQLQLLQLLLLLVLLLEP